MARYKGKDGAIQAGGVDIGEVESYDFELSINEMDADVIGDDWTDVEGGKKSGSGTISVLHDPGDAGQAELTIGDVVAIALYPESNTTGMTEIAGNIMVTNKSGSVSAGELVKATYNWRNKGALTETTVS